MYTFYIARSFLYTQPVVTVMFKAVQQAVPYIATRRNDKA